MTQRYSICLILIASAIGITCCCKSATAKSPKKYLGKVRETPDLMQTYQEANFLGGGRKFCAPVATSNALMWLGNHGYPKLLPKQQSNQTVAQVQMVHLLASEKMMATSDQTGTGPRRLMRGIEQYVENCGYSCTKILYQGWRPVPKKYRYGKRIPDLEWIKSEFANKRSAVLWNIGWYKAGKKKGEYIRLGGHWLTMVGYQNAMRNSPANDMFILHDPATRAGKSLSHERVFLKKLKVGTFVKVGKGAGLPVNAKGYYILGGDLHIKNIADFAILDGVVAVELKAEKSKNKK